MKRKPSKSLIRKMVKEMRKVKEEWIPEQVQEVLAQTDLSKYGSSFYIEVEGQLIFELCGEIESK